ncbi:MAG: hypothetical protein K6F24_05210 [Atopobiaceae bacterium]|nr:hypothetical protein [Atopobiaceae bacterium]
MSSKTKNMGLTKPDVTDEIQQSIKDIAKNFDLLDAMWPVGAIYQSTKPTDPSTFLGGTWSPINGVFLLAQSQKHPVGSTGGEEEHTLTVAEMPSHNHDTSMHYGTDSGGGYQWTARSADTYTNYRFKVDPTGGNQPHNNMPPYRSVFMWERTA